MGTVIFGYKRWLRQKYLLDELSLRELVKAYATFPAIQVYVVLAVASGGMALHFAQGLKGIQLLHSIALSAVLVVLIYPLVWYLLHRFVLHGRWLYKSRWTAALWKRIHFDHHQHPNDLGVLFGALHTTLPTIALVTISLGWLVGGPAGAATAFTMGLLTTCFYEFGHCIQHLNHRSKYKFLRRLKRLHLAHHFHNEKGNYGITNFLWDRALTTYYRSPIQVPRSSTVRNLGYVGAEAERYPWVGELTKASPADAEAVPEHGTV